MSLGVKSRVHYAAFLLVFGASCSNTQAQQKSVLDRSQLGAMTFNEDFSQKPSFYDPILNPDGCWKTNYQFGPQDPRSPNAWIGRTHMRSLEQQYYGDPLRGTNPFVWAPGSLTIVAKPSPYAANPATHGMSYISGLITTEKSFKQAYGYFEIRAEMSTGQGVWPAFWLLPEPEVLPDPAMRQLPDEVDVFENIGKDNEFFSTLHSNVDGLRDGTRHSDQTRVAINSVHRVHDYGVLITPADIRWYLDGVEIKRSANKSFHRPAYLLANLAIGGRWPGPPDATTPFPARMVIHYIRAYRLKDAAAYSPRP